MNKLKETFRKIQFEQTEEAIRSDLHASTQTIEDMGTDLYWVFRNLAIRAMKEGYTYDEAIRDIGIHYSGESLLDEGMDKEAIDKLTLMFESVAAAGLLHEIRK